MPITIGFVSDMHLEFRLNKFTNIIKMQTDILCLVGDICACGTDEDFNILKEFLTYICPKYKYVIHIAGNHEFYTDGENISKQSCMSEINKKLKRLEKTFRNYIYLNCQAVTLTVNNKKCVFIGATLWTHIDQKDYAMIQGRMNDYDVIYVWRDNKPVKLTVPEMQKIHKRHLAFVKSAIIKYKGLPCVLLTHHKPIADSDDPGRDTISAYETDITDIVGMPGSSVKYAIHGHTHKHYNKLIKGVRYLSNPKGYIYQKTLYKDDISISL